MTNASRVIAGRYCRTWTGKAQQNLVAQLPLIAASMPEVREFYPATVNVRFDCQIVVAGSDCRTPPLPWKAAGEDGESGEVFDLVRCRLTFIRLGVVAGAILYVGHWSLHRLDAHKHEFLVERFVEGLRDGDEVTMACDRRVIELPYSKTRASDEGPVAARTLVVL